MSEEKFTPGPWSVGRGYGIETAIEGWTYYPVHYGYDEENVCDIVYNKADADLIASAPEMYWELVRCANLFRDLKIYPVVNVIEALLRKARGES